MSYRKATHSGSWYTDSTKELNRQLENWLSHANNLHGPARAIIAPHAGYQYCGACAAFAYRQINPASVQRIFILGPSHHVRMSGCALSMASKYKTPFYDLIIDTEIYSKLEATGQFERMSMDTDENEHSIEMHLPYIAKIMQEYKDYFTIVPILVGSINADRESVYGKIFSQYLAQPENLFIISSDFCHWGQRFRYTYHDPSQGEIYQSITHLDKMGMNIIETLNPGDFTEYLKRYSNTICGRHPIGVLLQACDCLLRSGAKMTMKFLKYAQSSECRNKNDSSVSYASASLVFD